MAEEILSNICEKWKASKLEVELVASEVCQMADKCAASRKESDIDYAMKQ